MYGAAVELSMYGLEMQGGIIPRKRLEFRKEWRTDPRLPIIRIGFFLCNGFFRVASR